MSADLKRQLVKFSKIYLIAAVVLYVAFLLTGIPSEVGGLYFRYAEAMVSGNMPYSGFDAEYPPFAMVLILLPRLISFSPFTYQIAFGLEVYFFLLAGVYWTYRIAEKYTAKPSRCTDLFTIFSIILFDLALDRYDVFPMIMLLGSLYFFSEKKYNASWVMLALGTVTKLYPALIAPIYLIYFVANKQYGEAGKGIGICLLVGVLCMLPFFIADPETMLMFLTYHMDRGLQVEAPVSSFLMLLGNLGLVDVSYVFNYGSDNIFGEIPDAVAKIMMPLMIVCILALYTVYAARCSKNKDGDCIPGIVVASFATIMIFMLVNKVLSSQYLIWMIPFTAIIMILWERKISKNMGVLFAVSVALTQVNLIVNYAFRDAGEPFSLLGILIIVVRNAALLWMLYYLVRELLRKVGPSSGKF